ncbi:MAG: bifunctional riboflavin kinase/FAD synthetase [Candidatus Hydrogenedentes bacterium]|nr:bifunctional riboflavin kinase/FAD synthetase [Candidatus Hydrogenedentota bacterium]
MLLVEDIKRQEAPVACTALTIGSFDGLHLGHRRILDTVVKLARGGCAASVLTMRPHPRQFFTPDHAPNLLTNDEKKLALLEEAGMECVFILPFDSETANLSPRAFIQEILVNQCHVKHLVIGHDFQFGKAAEGDYSFLCQMADEHGYTVTQAPALLINGERVSSTAIRERIIGGDLEQARVYLGRTYSMMGKVEPGRGIGRTLGFPTANIRPYNNAVPAHGVYVGSAQVAGSTFPAAINVGIAPTIRHEDTTIEAYLLDFDDVLAETEIELFFHKRLRPERKFDSPKALSAQIARDVAEVRAYFAELGETFPAG